MRFGASSHNHLLCYRSPWSCSLGGTYVQGLVLSHIMLARRPVPMNGRRGPTLRADNTRGARPISRHVFQVSLADVHGLSCAG